MSTPAKRPLSPLFRARLAAIHLAKKNLGMADESYRAMLKRITGHESAGHCTAGQLGAVMEELKGFGAVFISAKRRVDRVEPASAAADKQPLLRKIDALLLDARPKRDRAYADAMAKRMHKVERLEFCTPKQLTAIIAALSYDQKRHGGRNER